jgi:hypothetical protein
MYAHSLIHYMSSSHKCIITQTSNCYIPFNCSTNWFSSILKVAYSVSLKRNGNIGFTSSDNSENEKVSHFFICKNFTIGFL